LRAFLHVVDAVSEHSGRVVSYGLIPLTLVVFSEVIARYVFNNPFVWSYETGMYLWGTVGVLAGAYTLLHHTHVRMDVIYNRFSFRGKAVVNVITAFFFFFYMIVLILSTGQLAIFSIQTNQHTATAWGPPAYPLKIVIFIAVFLLFLQGVAQFIRDLYHARHGKELPWT